MGVLFMGEAETETSPDVLDQIVAQIRARRTELYISDRQVSPREVTRQLIVCGNCAGDDRLPRKTFMAADMTCSTCGGRSWVLASKLFRPIGETTYEDTVDDFASTAHS